MEAFRINQQIFIFFGICPRPKDESFAIRLIRIVGRIIYTTILAGFGLFGSGGFVLKYISTNLEEALYALFPTVATTGFLYMYFTAYLQRNKIVNMIKDFRQVYDSSGHSI